MSSEFDPEDRRLKKLHTGRLIARDIDQLLGICEFALQDGQIETDEAESILAWLNNHRTCLDTWPASVLYDRLRGMLIDGKIDPDEQGELLSLVMRIARPRDNQGDLAPTTLPIDDPQPPIVFEDRSFCFTGVFDFGSRAECQAAVAERGGVVAAGITKKLNYLVIGNVGSEVWKHTSFGTKIAKAIEYRDAANRPAIISEDHWATFIAHP